MVVVVASVLPFSLSELDDSSVALDAALAFLGGGSSSPRGGGREFLVLGAISGLLEGRRAALDWRNAAKVSSRVTTMSWSVEDFLDDFLLELVAFLPTSTF